MQYDYSKILKGLFWGVFICVLITMCTSCKHTEYVSVPEYHEVYINKTDTLHKKDSVYVKDSLYVETRYDTTFITRYHTEYRDRLVYRNTTDTILKTDSISVPYEIEKPISALHAFTYNIGLLAILILVVMAVGYIIRKFIV